MTRKYPHATWRVTVCAAACISLLTPMSVHAQTQQPAQQAPQAQVAELATTVDKASADQPGLESKVASTKTNQGFEAKAGEANIKLPQNSSDGVTATKKSATGSDESVTVGLGGAESQGELAADGSVVYGGDTTTSQTVQVMREGFRIHNVMKSAEASTKFTHKLTLPEGARLIKASELKLDGEDATNAEVAAQANTEQNAAAADKQSDPILIVDKDNKLIAGFGDAWAKDASGKDVPTSYEVRDGALVQKVEHTQQDVQYPVVADPYLWMDLIKSAEWVHHDEGWTLNVTPTDWAGAKAYDIPKSYIIGMLGWDELYEKYKDEGRGIKVNLGGMRDQWICHQQFVGVRYPRKETWNLDEWREDVSYAETVNTRCNPGGDKIFD